MTSPKKPSRHKAKTVRSHKNSQIELVVTDADGTMWSFWNYFVPAMRSILPAQAEKLGIDKDVYSKEVGRVMADKGTHEYPWILELTPYARAFKGSRQQFIEQFVAPFWNTLDKFRIKYLQPFDEVRETLEALNQCGVKVAILSDAPYHMAVSRAVQMDVTHLISALYALDTPEPSPSSFVDSHDVEFGRARVNNFLHVDHHFERVECLPNDYEKPNERGLAKIISDFGVHPSKVLYIGDSLVKDGGVAEKLGVKFIWARYGIIMPGEYKVMINRHLNPNDTPITNGHNTAYIPKQLPPMIAQAATYAELLNHLTVNESSKSETISLATSRSMLKQPGH